MEVLQSSAQVSYELRDDALLARNQARLALEIEEMDAS